MPEEQLCSRQVIEPRISFFRQPLHHGLTELLGLRTAVENEVDSVDLTGEVAVVRQLGERVAAPLLDRRARDRPAKGLGEFFVRDDIRTPLYTSERAEQPDNLFEVCSSVERGSGVVRGSGDLAL